MRPHSRAFALAAVSASLAAACGYDFNAFEPTGDGGGLLDGGGSDAPNEGGEGQDTGSSSDATDEGDAQAVDDVVRIDAPASCTAPAGCLGQASKCGTTCTTTERSCEQALGCTLSPTCVQKCQSDESDCKKNCVGTCVVCGVSADAACADLGNCTVAAGAQDSGIDGPGDAKAD